MENLKSNFKFVEKWKEEELYKSIISFEEEFINFKDNNFDAEIGKILEEALFLTQLKFIAVNKTDTSIHKNYMELLNFVKDEGDQIPGGVKSAIDKFKFKRNISVHPNTKEEKEYLILNELTMESKLTSIQELHLVLVYLNNKLWSRQFALEKIDIRKSYSNDVYLKENENKEVTNFFEKTINVTNDSEYLSDDHAIKLSKESIGSLFKSNYEFLIPPYQRKYSWEINNIKELLTSVHYKTERKNGSSEFFGTIAITSNLEEKETNVVRLIDGQQRITSSLLIAKVIFDVFAEDIKDFSGEFPSELEMLFKKGEWKTKLKNATNLENEHKALLIILNAEKDTNGKGNELKNFKSTNILKNYLAAKEMIISYISNANNKEEYLTEFWNTFSSNFQIAVINFRKNKEEEMRIFENLNSKGMDLSTFELIKNSIFLKVESEEFEKNENEISKYFNNKIDFSNKDIIINSSKTKDIHKIEENFIYNFLTYIERDDKEISKTSKNLLLSFNELYMRNRNNISFEEYKLVIDEISKYSNLFLSLIMEEYKGMATHYLNKFEHYLDIFNSKEALIPFLFYLMKIYGEWNEVKNEFEIDRKDEKNIIEAILEIEKWSISLNQIVQGKSLKSPILALIKYLDFIEENDKSINFKNNMAKRIRKWLSGKEEKNNSNITISPAFRTPTKEAFVERLINMTRFYKKDDAMILLKRIEQNIIDPNLKGDVNLVFKKPSLEHIMPQSPATNSKWINIVEKRNPKKYENYDEIKGLLDNYVDRIGNYLWLDINDNIKAQNKTLDEKKNDYLNSRTASELKFTTKINNDFKIVTLFDDIEFSIEEIMSRSEAMANKIVEEIYTYD